VEGVVTFQDPTSATTNADITSPLPLYAPLLTGGTHGSTVELSRDICVSRLNWTPTNAFGSSLGTINFPDCLFADPFIASRLSYYSQFRAGFQFTVRLVASAFMYGAISVSWEPCTDLDEAASSEVNIYTASAMPSVVLDPSNDTSTTVIVPYFAPTHMLDLSTWRSGCLGSVDILVLAPLTVVQPIVSPSVTVEVYAHFIDPVLSWPSEAIVLNTPSPLTRRTTVPPSMIVS